MASVSLGAVSFLPPSSLHSVPPSQPKQNPHHRILEVNRGAHNSNITVSFSNPSTVQGMHILEDEDAGEPKLEIIEESQEETSPKETDSETSINKEFVPSSNLIQTNSIPINEEPKLQMNNRICSSLTGEKLCSKEEAVESLLLLGQGIVVADRDFDGQAGVRFLI